MQINLKTISSGLLVPIVLTIILRQSVLAQSSQSAQQAAVQTTTDQATEIRDLVNRLRSSGFWGPRKDPDDVQERLIAYGEAAVPFLIEGLSHEDEDVREYSAETLGMMGDIARPALPVLLGRLNSETQFAKFDFIRAILALLRPEDELALEPLLIFFRSELDADDSYNIGTVVQTFGVLGSRAAVVVPELVRLFTESDEVVGDETLASVLGRIGPAAAESMPQLVALLDDRLRGVDNTAAAAIVRIGLESSGVPFEVLMDELLEGFNYDIDTYRQDAAEAFSLLGDPAERYLVNVARQSEDQERLRSALNALDDINARSDRAVEVLMAKTSRPNSIWVRSIAALALGDVSDNNEVIEFLTRVAREDEVPFIRILSQRSLNKIHKDDASMIDGIVTPGNLSDVVGNLISLLDIDESKLSDIVIQALLEIGMPAVPQMIQALNTPKPIRNLRRRNWPNPTTSRIRKILIELGDPVAPYLIDPIFKSDKTSIVTGAIGILTGLTFEPQTIREKIVYYFVKDAANASKARSEKRPTYQRLSELATEAKPFLLRIAQMSGSNKAALAALAEFGPLSRDLVPVLTQLHKEGVIDDYYYTMMIKIGGDEAFEQYVTSLGDPNLTDSSRLLRVLDLRDMQAVNDQRMVEILSEMTQHKERGPEYRPTYA